MKVKLNVMLAAINNVITDKVLGCWCKPLPCHGDILAMYVEQMEMWTDMMKELLEESESLKIRVDAELREGCGVFHP
jgi:hypothetical protein